MSELPKKIHDDKNGVDYTLHGRITARLLYTFTMKRFALVSAAPKAEASTLKRQARR